jgi:hypothetical protein
LVTSCGKAQLRAQPVSRQHDPDIDSFEEKRQW